jgi:hypothetical protein
VTTYTPYPTVTFASGTSYTDQTIANISITLGRRDIMEQAQPGYARIELWTSSDEPIDVSLAESVEVFIKDTTGTNQQIFGGSISDIDISLDSYGSVGSIARYSITAVGPLALLNRRTAGLTGFAKEKDGTRILNVLTEAFLTNWSDVSPALRWNGVPTGTTWASYDGTSISLVNNLATSIDVPGQFELTAYSGGETNALTLVQEAAQSGRGVLFESEDGDIHYDDYSSRASNPVITLTADDILARGLSSSNQWSGIVNDVEVTYKNNQSKYARDEQSNILYGQLSGKRTTILENGTDAQTQADAFLTSRAFPRMYPETITCPLHSPTMTNATRNSLIDAIVGTGITTTALPAVFGETFNGYIEGLNWNLTRYTAELALTVSAQSETYPSVIWYQIPPTTTWAGYTPSTTEWQDL